ncbi:uncharacterized protein LOC128504304 [Spea bombifrons]|uniref:uncharacterized protein LOC128504304 n=1 Tax=Spea bombifrons TaxID=233779 RepID=UPI00234950F0|nr:uncharacterized protein LOC128504304 [Spea bombifrons]
MATGSNISICGTKCGPQEIAHNLHFKDSFLAHIPCKGFVQLDDHFKPRTECNVSSVCCVIRNAQRKDSGSYSITSIRADGKDVEILNNLCVILDNITGVSIRSNNSDLTTSLHVVFTGDMATVTWTRDGGDLPEKHRLSEQNRTLELQNEDDGTYRASVSNPLGTACAEYKLQGTKSYAGKCEHPLRHLTDNKPQKTPARPWSNSQANRTSQGL